MGKFQKLVLEGLTVIMRLIIQKDQESMAQAEEWIKRCIEANKEEG